MSISTDQARAIIAMSGEDRISFLQGLLTQDVTQLAQHSIQFAALLSPQGKILHDMFLIHQGDSILIDTAHAYHETLLKRLNLYKLRAKVVIANVSDQWQVRLGASGGLPDPRHPALPKRDYIAHSGQTTHNPPLTTHHSPLSLGIPELGRDFIPDEIVPMDAGYDLLNAISFHKGCYVGQEVTARMHYKNIARRGFYTLSDSSGAPQRLALLKFEEVDRAEGRVTVDNLPYTTALPDWMLPKYKQFMANRENQSNY